MNNQKIILILVSFFLIFIFCKNIYKDNNETFVSLEEQKELVTSQSSSSVSVNYFEEESIISDNVDKINQLKNKAKIDVKEIIELKEESENLAKKLEESKKEIIDLNNTFKTLKDQNEINIISEKNKLEKITKKINDIKKKNEMIIKKEKPLGIANTKYQIQKGNKFFTIKNGFFKKDNWIFDKDSKAWKVDLIISPNEVNNGFVVIVDGKIYKFKNKIFHDKLNKDIINPHTIIKDNIYIKRFYLKIDEEDYDKLPKKFNFKMKNIALRVNSGKYTGKMGVCLNKCKQIKNSDISECQLKNIGDKGYNYGYCCNNGETEYECRNRLGEIIENYDQYERYAVPLEKNKPYGLKCVLPFDYKGKTYYDCAPDPFYPSGLCLVSYKNKDYKAMCCPKNISKYQCETKEMKIRKNIDFENPKKFAYYIINLLKTKNDKVYENLTDQGKLLLIAYLLEYRDSSKKIFSSIFENSKLKNLIRDLNTDRSSFIKAVQDKKTDKKWIENLIISLKHFDKKNKIFTSIDKKDEFYNICMKEANDIRKNSLELYLINKKRCLMKDDVKYNLNIIIKNINKSSKNLVNKVLNYIFSYFEKDIELANKIFSNKWKEIRELF